MQTAIKVKVECGEGDDGREEAHGVLGEGGAPWSSVFQPRGKEHFHAQGPVQENKSGQLLILFHMKTDLVIPVKKRIYYSHLDDLLYWQGKNFSKKLGTLISIC